MRELKSKKAEKSVIDEEVALLLKLKSQLSLAQGTPPSAGKKSGRIIIVIIYVCIVVKRNFLRIEVTIQKLLFCQHKGVCKPFIVII